jgi:hypothetical protein
MFRRVRRLSFLLVLAAPRPASAAPPARDSAQALLSEVEKGPAAKDAARDAIAEARRALTRADRARLAGDQRHGAALEALALEWAETARDLTRAATAEERAATAEKKLGDATAALERAHTLVEQTNARRNRAEAQLHELEATRGPQNKPGTEAPKAPTPPKPRANGKQEAQ